MRSWLLVLVVLVVAHPVFAEDLAPVADIELEPTGRLEYMGYCPSKKFLAATIADGKLPPHSPDAKQKGALYQLDVASKRATRIGAISEATEFEFNADCSLLALGVSTGRDEAQRNEVHVYKTSTSATKQHVSFGGLASPVAALAFVDDNTLVVGISRGPVQLWSIAGTPRQIDKSELPGTVMGFAFANGLLAIGTYEGGVYLLPIAKGKLGTLSTLVGKDPKTRKVGSIDVDTGDIVMPGGGRVFEVAFVDGGKRLLATQEKGRVVAWPITNGKAGNPAVVASKLDGTNALAISTDEKLIATGDSYRVAVWNSAGNKHVTDLGKLDRVERYAAINGLEFVGLREVIVGAYHSAAVRLYRVN